MTKRRMIHDCLWKSEGLAELTIRQRLLWVGLITTSDDQGRGKAHPHLIRSMIFPFDTISPTEIQDDLQAIADEEMIIVYTAKKKAYYQIVNWWEYQQPQWAYPSEYPAPDGWTDRLRYRKDGHVLTENWKPDEGKKQTEPLPKALPKDLPNTDTLSDSQAHSSSISISSSISNSDSNKHEKINTLFTDIKTAWGVLFADKPQPRSLSEKHRRNLNARADDSYFMEHWYEALERASRVRALHSKEKAGWFDFWWVIANDEHIESLYNGKYNFLDGDKRTDREPPKQAKPVIADDADAFFRGAR